MRGHVSAFCLSSVNPLGKNDNTSSRQLSKKYVSPFLTSADML